MDESMSEHTDGNPEIDLDINAIVDRVLKEESPHILGGDSSELMRNLLAAHDNGDVDVNSVGETMGEVVKNEGYSQEMFVRHNSLLRRRELALAIYRDFMEKTGKNVRSLRKKLESNGAFFEDLPEEVCRERIISPNWVVTRAGGKIRKEENDFNWGDFEFAASMQVELPDDYSGTKLVTDIPNKSDKEAFYAGPNCDQAITFADKIEKNHAIAACIDNIEVWPNEYRKKGLGSLSRQTAIEHIKRVINPTRENAIQFLLANMFHVNGLKVISPKLEKPRLILGNSEGERKPIVNRVSILMHALSNKYDSILAWKIPGRPIPVSFTYEESEIEGELLIDWDTVVMKI